MLATVCEINKRGLKIQKKINKCIFAEMSVQYFLKMTISLLFEAFKRKNFSCLNFSLSKQINAQSLIRTHRYDFFLKINKRTCLSIRNSKVCDETLKLILIDAAKLCLA